MPSCYSLDPTGINAAYQEQEYRQKADDYRLLYNVIVSKQEIRSGLVAGSYLLISHHILEDILFTKSPVIK
jgi:hypothetical protein